MPFRGPLPLPLGGTTVFGWGEKRCCHRLEGPNAPSSLCLGHEECSPQPSRHSRAALAQTLWPELPPDPDPLACLMGSEQLRAPRNPTEWPWGSFPSIQFQLIGMLRLRCSTGGMEWHLPGTSSKTSLIPALYRLPWALPVVIWSREHCLVWSQNNTQCCPITGLPNPAQGCRPQLPVEQMLAKGWCRSVPYE